MIRIFVNKTRKITLFGLLWIILVNLLPSGKIFAANSSCGNPGDYLGSGMCCSSFLPGTKVSVGMGQTINIEKLKIGDEVLSFDNSLNVRKNKISYIRIGRRSYYYIVSAGEFKVEASANHPFYVGKDFKSFDGNVPVGYKRTDELWVGDEIYILNQEKLTLEKRSVTKITKIDLPVTVYSLTVDRDENYFANYFAVHNKGPWPCCGYGSCSGCPNGRINVTFPGPSNSCPAYNGDGCYDSPACICTPSCPTQCGQSDGCGGTCGTSDIGSYGSCSAGCGGGTQTDICGNTQSCNTQACCTSSAPGAPTLVSPANGTIITRGQVASLDWNAPVSFGTGCPSNNNNYTVRVGTSTGNYNLLNTNTGATLYNYTTTTVGNNYWRVTVNNGSQSTNSTTERNFCVEGGPYISAWSACNAVTHQRTRTCTSDCGGSACTGAVLTDSCLGTVTGTFFDASNLAACPANPQTLASNLLIPGGTASFTSSSINYNATTNSTGLYTQNVRSPDTYAIGLTPPANFVGTPKFICQGASATFPGSAVGCAVQPCETATRDFGFWKVYGGWWQAIGGQVHGSGGVSSTVPCTMPAPSRYMILSDAAGQHGAATTTTGTIDVGTCPTAGISPSGLNAISGYSGDCQNYNYFLVKMGNFAKTAWANAPSKPAYAPGTNGYQIFTYSGDITDFNFSMAAGEKMIFLVNGNVTVTGNVDVPTTPGNPSFLAVIAKGTINFASNVSRAEGWWVGNGVTVSSTGNTATDQQFIGEGSFVGCNSITLSRNRGVTNNSAPAERFVFRPDLFLNAPPPMSITNFIWKQDTP